MTRRSWSQQVSAHVAGDEIEAVPQGGDVFDKRLSLMTAWSDYCCSKTATEVNVVSMRSTVT
jgi:hypothetical protein